MTDMNFTMRKRDRCSASVLGDGRPVGHVGLMAGGTLAYINGGKVFGFAYASHHSATLESAFDEFVAKAKAKLAS